MYKILINIREYRCNIREYDEVVNGLASMISKLISSFSFSQHNVAHLLNFHLTHYPFLPVNVALWDKVTIHKIISSLAEINNYFSTSK